MNDFMMMEPTNQTFQELIGNGVKYQVPRFQRDYAWEQEQLEDLWADIETLPTEKHHYMGYIVLQRKSQHDFEVIDGQQRLITLSMIMLVAMRKIKELVTQGIEADANQERLKEITSRFIGSKDLESLRVTSKLLLNRNNHTFYKETCSNLAPPNHRGLTSTNKLLKKAFEFFLTKSMGDSGVEIAKFIERFSSGLIFTKIVVQDNLNAYKVFETLNARGVQLSTPDLLKNYIFSVVTQHNDVSDESLNDLDEQWSGIVSQLGVHDFTDFVRYQHNFQAKLVTKKDLFSAVRKLADTPAKAHQYLQSLTDYAPIYASLANPLDEWWAGQGVAYRPVEHYLTGFELFNIKQPFMLLMVAFKQFSAEEFIHATRYLYVLSIRYNVICHFSPNEQEKLYNQMAMKVFDGTYQRASHVKNGEEFKQLYPNDEAFYNAFEFHKMPSRQSSKKIRFLLAEIEQMLGHETDYAKTTLEHVCPYHPDGYWCSAFGDGVNDIQDRLGNMVLLEKDELRRANFEEKKQAYKQTAYPLARQVATYAQWDTRALKTHQVWLAKQAVLTWRVD